MSQIWALIVLPSASMDRVANSTPMVDFLHTHAHNALSEQAAPNKSVADAHVSRLNSFRVKRDSRFDLPTPLSPIKTTLEWRARTRTRLADERRVQRQASTSTPAQQ